MAITMRTRSRQAGAESPAKSSFRDPAHDYRARPLEYIQAIVTAIRSNCRAGRGGVLAIVNDEGGVVWDIARRWRGRCCRSRRDSAAARRCPTELARRIRLGRRLGVLRALRAARDQATVAFNARV